jgi:hypothetical protein
MTRTGLRAPPPMPIYVLPKDTKAQVELERTSFSLSWKTVLFVVILFLAIFVMLFLLG